MEKLYINCWKLEQFQYIKGTLRVASNHSRSAASGHPTPRPHSTPQAGPAVQRTDGQLYGGECAQIAPSPILQMPNKVPWKGRFSGQSFHGLMQPWTARRLHAFGQAAGSSPQLAAGHNPSRRAADECPQAAPTEQSYHSLCVTEVHKCKHTYTHSEYKHSQIMRLFSKYNLTKAKHFMREITLSNENHIMQGLFLSFSKFFKQKLV